MKRKEVAGRFTFSEIFKRSPDCRSKPPYKQNSGPKAPLRARFNIEMDVSRGAFGPLSSLDLFSRESLPWTDLGFRIV